MKLTNIVAWYQKKIGTYDKQQWEKTVEQRILNGFIHMPLKNTKLKTELIDVDLVRGSSFPKAKSKQNLLTVFKLSICRFVFLPLHAKWWVEQTSPKIFVFLLSLYLLQMVNWGVYSYNIQKVADTEHIISITELLIPMALSLILCTIHSQIVATSSGSQSSDKRKRSIHPKKKKQHEQMRRRKKMTRFRSTETKNNIQVSSPSDFQKSSLNSKVNMYASSSNSSVSNKSLVGKMKLENKEKELHHSKIETESNNDLTTDTTQNVHNLNEMDCSANARELNDNLVNNLNKSPNVLRKRNVYWDLPANNLNSSRSSTGITRTRSSHDVRRESDNNSIQRVENQIEIREGEVREAGGGDDDGFESLNGKSSSSEENVIGIEVQNNIKACPTNNVGQEYLKFPLYRDQLGTNPTTDSDTDTLRTSQVSKTSKAVIDKKSLNISFECKSNMKNTQDINPDRKDPSKLNEKSKTNQVDSTDMDEESEDGETFSSPGLNNSHFTEATTSATEWIGITTNSEDCSYSSELDHSASHNEYSENGGEYEFAPTIILNPICGNSDRISCTIWDGRETKKAEMSVLDISSAIIERVEAMPESCDYVYIGVALSIMLSLITAFCRLCEAIISSSNVEVNLLDMPVFILEKASISTGSILQLAFGKSLWENTVLINSLTLRFSLTFLFFFLLAVAEKTFKQRFLYAKLFSHLTSSRRARKSEVPHFRLNKVRNIKTWLSVRSYLMRRGPQRSVDVIVSAAFILTLLLLAFLSVEWLKDSVHLHLQFNLEALLWACAVGCFLLRFMTLGTKINRKYRSISVLITEQINLYLQIEQKPQKKEELMVANSVLKLAADLLKELDSPFKISGLSANPYLYTTVKVVILSALSGVLSEMLGFKLKLHKIKIK